MSNKKSSLNDPDDVNSSSGACLAVVLVPVAALIYALVSAIIWILINQ